MTSGNEPHPRQFLYNVAKAYASQSLELIEHCCFIFPNKRSGAFFSNFFKQVWKGKKIEPVTMTISSFVAAFSDLKEASRYDLLFTLYNEYTKLNHKKDDRMDFDSFQFWGEMLLSDFNDVDRYLVDPDTLFVNVKKFKEIQSNYLTEEQRDAIRRYWGEETTAPTVEDFWKHVKADKKRKSKERFLRLWEILGPLYHSINNTLEANGLTMPGRLDRNAVNRLKDRSLPFNFEHYVFIGFNVLTTAETKIFRLLQAMDKADFYWDFNSPALADESNKAGRFIRHNIAEFKSRYKIEEELITEMPEIEIIGVPGSTSQVKLTGNLLREMTTSEQPLISDPVNAINTAVVLPDESLFVPLLNSIPQEIKSINVTMGLPMRHNPIYALFHAIILMQGGMSLNRGIPTFFFKHVNAIISSPIVRTIASEECVELETIITQRRLYRVPIEEIHSIAPSLDWIFQPVTKNAGIEEICDYLISIINRIYEVSDPMQKKFAKGYALKIEQIREACVLHNITMRGKTLFKMIERSMLTEKLPFKGEPLSGLQIMGVLETRALDFDNVIMLSMNERIFPRRHYSGSFIPDTLRRAYGMATTDFQESIFAYYFYRLISRARHVTLIYDARTIGTATGEMSRYLSQILYLFSTTPNGKRNVTHRVMKFDVKAPETKPISVPKSPEILKKMQRFTTSAPEGQRRYLSASSINTFIRCPLEFYLRYVEGYDPENEVTDYMDSSTYGTAGHSVLEQFYKLLLGDKNNVVITADVIREYLKPENSTIDRLIVRAFNKEYNHLPENKLDTPLVGDALIMGQVSLETIKSLLKSECELTPFTCVGTEAEMKIPYQVNSSLTINIRQFIDRVDKIDSNTVRLVDYKTGSDVLDADSVEQLFNHTSKKNVKAFMQLLLYCTVYSIHEHFSGAIQPIIFSLHNVVANGIKPLTIAKEVLTDYRPYAEEFERLLKEKIKEMYNPDLPFNQTADSNDCTFCNFRRICGRG